MNQISIIGRALWVLFYCLIVLNQALAGVDPLPSWRDGTPKQTIVGFVSKVTDKLGEHYIPPAERIATFDNDGTLWTEQPMYVQLLFAIDRVKALANQHPEWKNQQPFKAVLDNDVAALLKQGEHGVLELIMATHAGMTTTEFANTVESWLATARHPRFNKPYTELVYQPMLELLNYLRANGFKTYIVSGGGIEFMRPWTETVYGIPPEQVIGSSIKTQYQEREGNPVIVRLPEINFIDDKAGKPVAINQVIGRRPIAAFGNSDGDLQMLQWTAAGNNQSLQVIIHHTDPVREYQYDRKSKIGRLNKALDIAHKDHWTVVDMKNDWKVIFPFQLQQK